MIHAIVFNEWQVDFVSQARSKEVLVNLLDMHTREKANKIHIDEMHENARNHHMLRNTHYGKPQRFQKEKLLLFLIFATLIILIGIFLVSAVVTS